jgi:hypothetical protein
MASALMCQLPHSDNGVPKGWTVNGVVQLDRLSCMWRGRVSDVERSFLDDLSAQIAGTGICPNHLRIVRSVVARAIATGR